MATLGAPGGQPQPATDDPELRDGPRCDLHSLRARDPALDSLCDEIQRSAATRAAAGFVDTPDMAALRKALCEKSVLLTGSAGYLGAALHMTLQKLGVAVVGVDVVPGATVDEVVDVADPDAIKRCGQPCGAVFHCAALHAPHALSWHAREFEAANVTGTANVLALGLPTVHTSTTSLTITPRVKAREKAGELVWLDESAQRPERAGADAYDPPLDAPRNKYGRTKAQGEQRCLAAARDGAEVVILRAPRFFPEDVIEETSLTLPNIKANELLGRRCALVDLIDAHLRALARVRDVRGAVFTLVAPWPLERHPGTSAHEVAALLRERHPHAERLYARHGWRLPDAITRVYDSKAAIEALGWQPLVTFEALLRLMEQREQEGLDEPASLDEREQPRKQPKGPTACQRRGDFEEMLRGAY